jgi:hypothetical protein
MNIIRDDELFGLMMIPLFQQWNIHRCNIKDCKEKPTTIITGIPDVPIFGMCEKHYDECKKAGKINHTLDFKS